LPASVILSGINHWDAKRKYTIDTIGIAIDQSGLWPAAREISFGFRRYPLKKIHRPALDNLRKIAYGVAQQFKLYRSHDEFLRVTLDELAILFALVRAPLSIAIGIGPSNLPNSARMSI
jgi:hypothetical protein